MLSMSHISIITVLCRGGGGDVKYAIMPTRDIVAEAYLVNQLLKRRFTQRLMTISFLTSLQFFHTVYWPAFVIAVRLSLEINVNKIIRHNLVSDCAHVDAILLRGANGRGHSMRMAEHQDLLNCLSGEWLQDQPTKGLGNGGWGVWCHRRGGGLRQIKHLLQSPFTGKFF